MYFFDLLYLKVYNWYSDFHYPKSEGGSTCFLIAGLLLFNILSLLFIINYGVRNTPIDIPKISILVLYLCLFVISYVRYIHSDKALLRVKYEWENKSAANKRFWSNLLTLYIIGSFALLIGTVVYFVAKR